VKRFAVFFFLVLITGLGTIASAQEENRAGLVVIREDGEVITRCVNFSEPEITGLELLSRAELDLITSSVALGAKVCSIAGQGCPAEDCFCQCQGSDCIYWSYWHLQEDGWRYANAGAGIYPIRDGDVDAWTWGPGTPQNAPEPTPLTFADICAAEPAAVETSAATAIIAATGAAVSPVVGETAPLSAAEPAPTAGDGGYLNYLLFALIILLLAGILLFRRERSG